jgi:hypothetical protein
MSKGEFLTRLAMWITLAGYGVGAALYWTARGRRQWEARARWGWTVGCMALLVHVAFALHFYQAWQHDSVWRETARQTAEVVGLYWGGGVFFNYALMLGWVADTLWWWRGLDVYRQRSRVVTGVWHGFLLFMFFNATVVFKTGWLRWLGLFLCAGLVLLWWRNATGKRASLNFSKAGTR